ncbi:hypothetical protein Hypma_005657 [Hypsizygus marmoreus]|uniref:F-box domain-containing protein n=1 Tax=Hypsizygus marmoreus TaxID=39966 RepID=A0A369JZC4_HYPMA|nr:hypothetical protein Hypma_005657 [Hypsizygus marmoreus]
MISPSLPPEITDNIIDVVHESNDIQTLKACSLVSSIFRIRSQRNLYDTITIKYPFSSWNAHPAQPFVDVLLIHPELAEHIRNLLILDFMEGEWQMPVYGNEIVADSVLPQIFKMLGSLTSFTLMGPLYHGDDSTRPLASLGMQLTTPFTLELLNMFVRTEVIEINIGGVRGIPLSRIASTCPHLRRLSITQLPDSTIGELSVNPERFNSTTYPPLPEEPQLADMDFRASGQLERLSLDACSVGAIHHFRERIINEPRCLITLAHLRELNITGCDLAMTLLAAPIIADAARTLDSFLWEVPKQCRDFALLPILFEALGNTTNLHTLRLVFTDEYHFSSYALLQLPQMFEHLSASNKLEELVIAYSPKHLIPFGTESEQNWASSLDTLLSKGQDFPFLRHVCVLVSVEYRHMYQFDASTLSYSDQLHDAFSQLSLQKKLRLSMIVDRDIDIHERIEYLRPGSDYWPSLGVINPGWYGDYKETIYIS